MPCLQIFAADISLSDSELTFIKFAGYLLVILWACYLIKELAFSHRADPAIAALVNSQVGIAANVATIAAQSMNNGDRITELREQQIADTQAIFRKIDLLDQSYRSTLSEHDRELGKLEGAKGHGRPAR